MIELFIAKLEVKIKIFKNHWYLSLTDKVSLSNIHFVYSHEQSVPNPDSRTLNLLRKIEVYVPVFVSTSKEI